MEYQWQVVPLAPSMCHCCLWQWPSDPEGPGVPWQQLEATVTILALCRLLGGCGEGLCWQLGDFICQLRLH